MTEFPVFDAQRRCPKCGGDASVKWQGKPNPSVRWQFWAPPWDVIVRRCTRCAHAWYESPLDEAEDAA